MFKNIITSAWSLLNFFWNQTSFDIKERYLNNRKGISKHTRWIKRHFDKAYNLIKNNNDE